MLQKKIIRAITFSDFSAHSAPLLKNLDILKVDDLFNAKTASLMWDFDHNNLLNSLSVLFQRREEVHSRNLRDRNKNKIYTAQRYKNRYGFDSFAHRGGMLLNKIKCLTFYNNSSSKVMFLKGYKNYVINNY